MKHIVLALTLLFLQEDPVRKLIQQLGSDDYADREKATEDLVRLGESAIPALQKAATSDDAEVRSRAEAALRRIKRVSFRGEKLLAGRIGSKKGSVEQGGGSPETEDAVLAALRWLSRHQAADGSWKAKGHVERCVREKCPSPATVAEDFDTGVTGLALLAFLGSGYSHLSKDTYDEVCFGDVVRKALQWIMSHQDPEGCIGPRSVQKYMYGHAMVALALAEAYGLTGSNLFKDPAQKAADFTIAAQNPGRGWRYSSRCDDNDTSVTFWATLGLGVARHAGLAVPDKALAGAQAWLDEVTEEAYGRVGYTHRGTGKVYVPGQNENFDHHEALTAAGVFLRIMTGADRKAHKVHQGYNLLLRDRPKWEGNLIDFYYWHLGTLAVFQRDGPDGTGWKAWNEALKEAIVKNQRAADAGCRAGSWDAVDRWSGESGRVYATAINALTLETYYRYRLVSKE